MTTPFFTVGHSDRSLQDFIALIRDAGVGCVADIRKMPMSRANPQFNQDVLSAALAAEGIGYEHVAHLGGLRGKARDVPFEVNALWRNRSFHNYADYALSPEFRSGLDHILRQGAEQPLTVMCSEAVWWRCHRRIVADYLIAQGRQVLHVMGEGRLEPAVLTPGAVIQHAGRIVYPPETEGPRDQL
ncbi:DUF488 family protein [uncultured Paracoccus sp.]|uniref:DUF488 domain-containing protein n=1 Tax=Paracoccus sp. S1E-3 TaxID=2756130 RepID=UPI0015EED3BD|nr:DUF488 domain-containing protein [uncultured Paracoccus sp.]MBA4490810.1 DUF488 domain-containing protein [Paracoccus sp. S1E-3]